MSSKVRTKTWWCLDHKHDKCGRMVSHTIGHAGAELGIKALARENFTFSPCTCHCQREGGI